MGNPEAGTGMQLDFKLTGSWDSVQVSESTHSSLSQFVSATSTWKFLRNPKEKQVVAENGGTMLE